MNTPNIPKFSSLFQEESGGEAPPGNVTADVATPGYTPKKKDKDGENAFQDNK